MANKEWMQSVIELSTNQFFEIDEWTNRLIFGVMIFCSEVSTIQGLGGLVIKEWLGLSKTSGPRIFNDQQKKRDFGLG